MSKKMSDYIYVYELVTRSGKPHFVRSVEWNGMENKYEVNYLLTIDMHTPTDEQNLNFTSYIKVAEKCQQIREVMMTKITSSQ